MCFTITTQYIQCSHETKELHECGHAIVKRRISAPWSIEDQEHDFLQINRVKIGSCPECSGEPIAPFKLPREEVTVNNLPPSLQQGQPLFRDIVATAYDSWVINNGPFAADTLPNQQIQGKMVVLALRGVMKNHNELLSHPDPNVRHPLPRSLELSLLPSIYRELFIIAAQEARYRTLGLEIRDEFLQPAKEKLLRDLQGKFPFSNPIPFNQLIDNTISQLKTLRHQITASQAEQFLRNAVFEQTTHFEFPACIIEEKKHLASAIVSTIHNHRYGDFKNIPEHVLERMIGESEVEAWTKRKGLDGYSEGEIFFEGVLRKLGDWVLKGKGWQDLEDVEENQEDFEGGVFGVEEVEESMPLLPNSLAQRPKLTLKTSFL